MSNSSLPPGHQPRRILVVDDNEEIHKDFRKVLCPRHSEAGRIAAEADLFGPPPSGEVEAPPFVVHSALQGRDGADMVANALQSKEPYAVAFIDMRMPPGWDGLETILHIVGIDANIEIVICSAYSDYSRSELIQRVARPALQFLPKPFRSAEVLHLAWTLSHRWLTRRT